MSSKYLKKTRGTSGFTLVEIVLTLSIMLIGFGLSILYYQTTQVRADLNAQVAEFVGYARLTQSSAEAGKGGTSHGIHIETDSYVIFNGDTYDADEPSNFEIVLPDTITISEHSLRGGGDNLIFTTPNGNTDKDGTVTFLSEQINQDKVITITNVGSIYY